MSTAQSRVTPGVETSLEGGKTRYRYFEAKESVLRPLMDDLFANHWSHIVIGPCLEGVVYEIQFEKAPNVTHSDGYMTVDLGKKQPGAMDHFTQATRFDREVKTLRVVEGNLFVCQGCCCRNVEAGNPPVPLERFKKEWKERGIRSRVHLTVSGCLGPCSVPNIVLLMYRGETVWFHSINSNHDVVLIYDYIERLLQLNRFVSPQEPLSRKVFQRYLTDALFPERP